MSRRTGDRGVRPTGPLAFAGVVLSGARYAAVHFGCRPPHGWLAVHRWMPRGPNPPVTGPSEGGTVRSPHAPGRDRGVPIPSGALVLPA